MTTIDEAGKMTHEKAIRSKGASFLNCPRLFEKVNDETIILYGQLTTKYRYGKLTFPEEE